MFKIGTCNLVHLIRYGISVVILFKCTNHIISKISILRYYFISKQCIIRIWFSKCANALKMSNKEHNAWHSLFVLTDFEESDIPVAY